ncbi:hypothetical protein QTP70_012979 [Hemibagrus guttatus]|uniref:Gypsy retrotransposon integrase-like protein 1 n=1 Tax=Hemibagrus guttatus TaxID=175788 RepID=A0AAE0QRP1_9TELE|nr:hypothetical protein QTP70_012979 [Hemibagrus guttatus]
MRKSGVAEKYVRVVQYMYERSRTVVRCAVGQTVEFKVEVRLHQGSALSPFLFAMVMDQLSEEVKQESPWTMMFALERRGMKVSRSKTEYMCVNEREGYGTVRLQGEEVKKVQEFKYLGSTVQSNGKCGKEVKKQVQAGWNGWRKVSGVLCDRKISARIFLEIFCEIFLEIFCKNILEKGKVYKTVVRPAMLYGLETVSLRKRQESEKTRPNIADTSMSHSDPFQDLVAALRQALTAHPAPTPAPPATTSANTATTLSPLLYASPMAKPVPYYGSAEDCNGFLLQCSLVLAMQPHMMGLEWVLSQQQGNPSRLHPCAFFSRKLNPAEVNYDIGNRELLAVKLAHEEWRHWLEGARHPFLVLTDHKNLEYLRAAKRLNPRQARWALFFTHFNFTISYRPGSKNTKADALSRLFTPEENSEEPETILPEKVIVSPITWSEETLPSTNASTNTPLGCPPGLKYITRARRTPLIHSAHTSLGTGHPGVNETLSLLKDRFWWPNMASDVRRYVQGCRECAISKSPRHLPSGKLLLLPVPNRPWSHLGVDFITDLPASNDFTCIFVVVDRFSKSCRLIPLKGLPTAMETAELMFNHIFRYFGIPEDIVSDQGPQFISRVWKAFFSRLGVAVSLSSGYHPQTNGQTERKIQEIGRYLRTFCQGHQDSWSQYLGGAEYAQNSLRQPSTGLTPFQCVLGYQPPLFPWSGELSNVPAVDYWFRESKRVWDSAHHQLQRALRRRRLTADLRRSEAPVYQPGQKVWLSTRDIHLRQPCRKLSPRFIGPFTILEQINPVTYKLQLPPEYRIHPTFHVSLLKPHHPSVSPSTEPGVDAAKPPLPLLLDDGAAYGVREILDSRRRGGQLEYLVDWEGYGPEECSWVPRNNILDPNLLETFHSAHPNRPAPRGRGRPPRRQGPRPSGAGRGEGGINCEVKMICTICWVSVKV